MAAEKKNFLVFVSLDSAGDMRLRLDDVPGILAVIKSAGDCVQLGRSSDGFQFCLLVHAGVEARLLWSRLDESSHTNNKDSIAVIELGKAFKLSQTLSRVGAWLQHH